MNSGMLLYLHHRYSKLFFHPAKFDNFKDEKISDYKTVLVAQRKNLLDWKLLVLEDYEQLFRTVFFMFWGQFFFFKYCSIRTKKLHKISLKKHVFLNRNCHFKIVFIHHFSIFIWSNLFFMIYQTLSLGWNKIIDISWKRRQ